MSATTDFVYPRKVSFYRETTQLGVGAVGYMGHKRTTETLLFAGIQASFQCPSVGTRRVGDGVLPDDAAGPVRWNIFLAKDAIPKGSVVSRDIAIDDEGNRYQVVSAYWTPISWKIQTTRLEA